MTNEQLSTYHVTIIDEATGETVVDTHTKNVDAVYINEDNTSVCSAMRGAFTPIDALALILAHQNAIIKYRSYKEVQLAEMIAGKCGVDQEGATKIPFSDLIRGLVGGED